MKGLSRRSFVGRLVSAASTCALQCSAGCRTEAEDEPVIDVHIHTNFHDSVLKSQAERESGVDYSPEGLRREMAENNVRHALSIGFTTDDSELSREAANPMGAGSRSGADLADIVSWIGGVNPYRLDETGLRRIEETLDAGELKGLKIYLGYYPLGPDAQQYRPVYELAARYRVPVIFHTGDTYSADARVRFAHPLPIDDVAVEFREVTFVLAHLGNPWTIDAAELLYKNENVYGDLSGFFVGDRNYFSDPANAEGISHAIDRIRQAFAWVENPKKFMFGTDWPLVPIGPYVNVMRKAIPRRHHRSVFYSNAVAVFGLPDPSLHAQAGGLIMTQRSGGFPMKKDASNPTNSQGHALSRRSFLQAAGAAGLSLQVEPPAAKARTIDPNGPLRVGLIGSNGHTGYILDSLPRIENARLVAFAKSRPEDDDSWIRRRPSVTAETRVYGDFQELFENEELDVVGVCMPFYQNAAASIEAARRGIHVVSEKPAATTRADLDRLTSLVEKTGIRYSLMLSMRTNRAFRAAQTAVKQGLIGEPVLVYSQKSYKFGESRPWYYRRRETYGGTIPWVGIHAVDSMRWASGQEFVRVAAHHGNKTLDAYPACEDHAGILFELANGGSGVCHLDYLRPETASTHGDDRLRLAGTEGVVEVIETGKRAVLLTRSQALHDLKLAPPVDFFATFVDELRGRGTHLVGSQEALAITRVCLIAREAADSGRWIEI